MKVRLRGYARNCGWWAPIDSDVAEVDLPRRGRWRACKELSLMRTETGVVAQKSPVHLSMNGRYFVNVELSKEEIRTLFLQTHAEELAGAFSGLDALLSARKKLETPTTII